MTIDKHINTENHINTNYTNTNHINTDKYIKKIDNCYIKIQSGFSYEWKTDTRLTVEIDNGVEICLTPDTQGAFKLESKNLTIVSPPLFSDRIFMEKIPLNPENIALFSGLVFKTHNSIILIESVDLSVLIPVRDKKKYAIYVYYNGRTSFSIKVFATERAYFESINSNRKLFPLWSSEVGLFGRIGEILFEASLLDSLDRIIQTDTKYMVADCTELGLDTCSYDNTDYITMRILLSLRGYRVVIASNLGLSEAAVVVDTNNIVRLRNGSPFIQKGLLFADVFTEEGELILKNVMNNILVNDLFNNKLLNNKLLNNKLLGNDDSVSEGVYIPGHLYKVFDPDDLDRICFKRGTRLISYTENTPLLYDIINKFIENYGSSRNCFFSSFVIKNNPATIYMRGALQSFSDILIHLKNLYYNGVINTGVIYDKSLLSDQASLIGIIFLPAIFIDSVRLIKICQNKKMSERITKLFKMRAELVLFIQDSLIRFNRGISLLYDFCSSDKILSGHTNQSEYSEQIIIGEKLLVAKLSPHALSQSVKIPDGVWKELFSSTLFNESGSYILDREDQFIALQRLNTVIPVAKQLFNKTASVGISFEVFFDSSYQDIFFERFDERLNENPNKSLSKSLNKSLDIKLDSVKGEKIEEDIIKHSFVLEQLDEIITINYSVDKISVPKRFIEFKISDAKKREIRQVFVDQNEIFVSSGASLFNYPVQFKPIKNETVITIVVKNRL